MSYTTRFQILERHSRCHDEGIVFKCVNLAMEELFTWVIIAHLKIVGPRSVGITMFNGMTRTIESARHLPSLRKKHSVTKDV